MTSSKNLKLGGILSYIGIAVTIITGFIYTPLMINNIGKSNYALFTLAMSFISFFILDFGISAAITRYVSIYKVNNEEHKINDFLGITIKLFLIIDFIIMVILFTGYFFLEDIFLQLTTIELLKFKKVYIIIAIYSILSFPFMPINAILTSYEEFTYMKTVDLLQKIFSFMILLIAIWLKSDLYTIVFINTFTNFFNIFLKYRFIKKKLHIKSNIFYQDRLILKDIISFSTWSTIILISQRFILNIGPTLLGRLSGTDQIAFFSIGSSIEGYFWLFANALNSLFLPSVSRIMYNKNNSQVENRKDLEVLSVKVGRIQLMISGILYVIFLIIGEDFLFLWLSGDYSQSYYVIVLLILPGIITYTQTIAYNFLTIANEIKYRAFSFIGSAVISVVLSVILIPKMGAIGMALGASLGIICGQILLLNYFLQKKFTFNLMYFFKNVHLKLLPFFSLVSLILFSINKLFFTSNIKVLLLKIIIFSLIYIILLFLVGLNHYEKKVVNGLLKKMIRR